MRSSSSGTLKRREEGRVAKFLAIESGASIYALGAFGFSVFSDHVRYTCFPYSEMSGERSTTRAVGPSAKPRSPQIFFRSGEEFTKLLALLHKCIFHPLLEEVHTLKM